MFSSSAGRSSNQADPPFRKSIRLGAADKQAKSAFFSLLPSEIRLHIYRECFGDGKLHLSYVQRPSTTADLGNECKWRSALCCYQPDSSDSWQWQCVENWHRCFFPNEWQVPGLGLLMACRKTLEEGIVVLFQTNTFIINDPVAFVSTNTRSLLPYPMPGPLPWIYSLRTISPTFWPLVTSVHFAWQVIDARQLPHREGRLEYLRLWDAVAALPHLRELRFALMMRRYETSPGDGVLPADFRALFLDPITRAGRLRLCEVAMARSYCQHFGVKDGGVFFENALGAKYRLFYTLEDEARSEAYITSLQECAY